jgi:hypothetical protein
MVIGISGFHEPGNFGVEIDPGIGFNGIIEPPDIAIDHKPEGFGPKVFILEFQESLAVGTKADISPKLQIEMFGFLDIEIEIIIS